MKSPHITALVHGGPTSIEAIRMHGLTRRLPEGAVRYLFREEGRGTTARRWQRDLRQNPAELIYVCNTAVPGAPLAVAGRLNRGVPYVLDTGDAVFEMARRSGIGAGWRLPLLWLVETLAQRHASAIVVRGTRHREFLESRGHRRVVLIRDGFAEQDSATPEAVSRRRRELGLEGRFVIGLMGSLVYSPRLRICYGWDLVEALVRLRDLPVQALVIGDGNGRAWLGDRAQASGVRERMHFCGRIPYPEVPVYLRLMDVALSTQTNNLPGQVRTTGKLPEYMAAERFILASRVGEAALMLPGLMLLDFAGEVDPTYPARLAERIRLLHRRPELLELRRSLPGTVRELCSYDRLSGTWMDLVNLLLPAGGYQASASPA